MGNLFFLTNQIDRAVESLESALAEAKKVYAGKPHLARIMNNLGMALKRAGMLDESLRYFQEAKEMIDEIQGANDASTILNNIGTVYHELGYYLKALQSFNDALGMTVTCGVSCEMVCTNMVETIRKLNTITLSEEETLKIQTMCASFSQTMVFSLSKENQVKVVETDEKRPLTKDTCPDVVNNLYTLSLLCKGHGEQSEVLKHLEKAREVAKRFDYKCGKVILVLMLLSNTYGEMGCVDKSKSYFEEAKEMVKRLPPEDDSILPGEMRVIESMRKEC